MIDDMIDHQRRASRAPEARFPRSDGTRFATALAAATLLHIGVFVVFARLVEPELTGASGADAAASSIEVTLVSARALESRTKTPTHAAAVTVFEAIEGSAVETPDGAVATSTPIPSTTAEDAAADHPTDRRKTLHPSEVLKPDDARARESQPPDVAAQQPGGATARSVDRMLQPTAGAAAASPGAAVAYARAVASALGHSRPKAHHPVGGTVRILFAIGDDGGVDELVLKRSSGRTTLDTVAIEAVRRTRFPTPPSGLSSAQRTFEIPYHFR